MSKLDSAKKEELRASVEKTKRREVLDARIEELAGQTGLDPVLFREVCYSFVRILTLTVRYGYYR